MFPLGRPRALLTSRLTAGAVVPMPMLPLGATKKRDVLPVMKLMDAFEAMLLIRYSWVTLLKPWNWASAPNWSQNNIPEYDDAVFPRFCTASPVIAPLLLLKRRCSWSSGVVVPIPTAPVGTLAVGVS